jgi:outer membrane receptor protein involved in Fe transport
MFAALAVLLLAATPRICAQAGLSSYITGVVTDPSGAAIPGAKVIVTSERTGVKNELSTTSTGLYRSPNLLPGPYLVEAYASGFRPLIRRGLTLEVGQALAIDLKLELGALTQRIEVTGAAPVLDTQGAQVGQGIPYRMVEALPLLDRRVGGLISFAPGADFNFLDLGSFATPNYKLAGSGRATYTIGDANVSSDRTRWNGMFADPPIGAVEETLVVTSGYNAEYGGSEGSLVTMQLKSGTNKYHGDLWYNFRNEALDARDAFAEVKAVDRYHVWGAAIGGPIVKDRTFFFVSTEWTKVKLPRTSVLTVPTLEMLRGDFSKFVTDEGELIPIYDPATTRPDPESPWGVTRDQFPGNIIPSDRFDPVAVNIAKFFPAPNRPGTIGGTDNYVSNWSYGTDGWAHTSKVDHRISDRDQFSVQFLFNKFTETKGTLQGMETIAQGDPGEEWGLVTWYYSSFLTGSETHTFSPTLLNQATFTWHRKRWQNRAPSYDPEGKWPEKLGLKNVYSQEGFPRIGFGGYLGMGAEKFEHLGMTPISTFNFSDTITKVKGNHSFKFGADAIYGKSNFGYNETPAGSYSFDGRETGLINVPNTGNSIASLLLGQVDGGSVVQQLLDRKSATTYYGLFGQDHWRVTPKLTLDLGLRWEVDTPPGEKFNRGGGFDLTTINPVSGTPGVITFLGVTMPDKFRDTDYTRVQPRVGFAYNGRRKTVLRGGYGIYSQFNDGGASAEWYPCLGFDPVRAEWSTPDDGITPAWILRDGLPAWKSPGPEDRTPGYGAVPLGETPTNYVMFNFFHRRFGYSQHFNLSLEQELPGQMVLEVGGEGVLGRRLGTGKDFDQVPPDLALEGNNQLRRPFPQFWGVGGDEQRGISNYYALTIRVEKKYSHGLTFMGNYTFAKNIGLMGCDDEYNCQLSHGPIGGPSGSQGGDWDAIPYHHSKIAVVYELPMGVGKRFATSGPAARIFGDWKVSFVPYMRSGYPFGLGSDFDSQNRANGIGNRLDLIGKLRVDNPTPAQWFNQDAVARPPFGRIGNLGPGVLTGPGLVNLDMSILKDIRFTERVRLELRGEFFNALNHLNWGFPGTTYGEPNFGVITGGSTQGSRIIQIGVQIKF